MPQDIRIYPTPMMAARALASEIVLIAEQAIATRGRFALALCGGSTPTTLYKLLAESEFADRIDWEFVHVFWGDERCVPPEHADSNYHMARLALLDHVPIPLPHIHRMHGELPPELGAVQYEQTLREYFERREGGATGPRFDLVLLGMGDDGHTASLFPNSPALAVSNRWVMEVHAEHLKSWRLTLTPVALNAAARAFFFVTGESKAAMLPKALGTPDDESELPVHYITPALVRWYVDEAAGKAVKAPVATDVSADIV